MHQLPRQGRGSCTCKPHTLVQPPLWQPWSCSCGTALARRGRRALARRRKPTRRSEEASGRAAQKKTSGCDGVRRYSLSSSYCAYCRCLAASAGNALRRAIRAPCPRCAARPAPQPTSLVSRSTTRARADRRGRVGLLLGQTAHCTCVRAGLRHDVNARCAGLRAVWLAAHDPRRGRIEELGRGE